MKTLKIEPLLKTPLEVENFGNPNLWAWSRRYMRIQALAWQGNGRMKTSLIAAMSERDRSHAYAKEI